MLERQPAAINHGLQAHGCKNLPIPWLNASSEAIFFKGVDTETAILCRKSPFFYA